MSLGDIQTQSITEVSFGSEFRGFRLWLSTQSQKCDQGFRGGQEVDEGIIVRKERGFVDPKHHFFMYPTLTRSAYR